MIGSLLVMDTAAASLNCSMYVIRCAHVDCVNDSDIMTSQMCKSYVACLLYRGVLLTWLRVPLKVYKHSNFICFTRKWM